MQRTYNTRQLVCAGKNYNHDARTFENKANKRAESHIVDSGIHRRLMIFSIYAFL